MVSSASFDINSFIKEHGFFSIAEIGLNHGGNVSNAYDLIRAAKKANFHAVKFQLRSPSIFLKSFSDSSRDLGSEIVDDYIANTFIPYDQYKDLYIFAQNLGLVAFFSSWDMESLAFAVSRRSSHTQGWISRPYEPTSIR